MVLFIIVISICMVSLASAAMEGVSDNEEWAYQWYTGEPFRFKCQSSGLNITSDYTVEWNTPTMKSLTNAYNQTDYELKTVDNIIGVELVVKKIKAEFHGIYTCNVLERKKNTVYGKVVYGLNIHDVKYHDLIDKYRSNIIVAVVATAVFIVPFATTCLVWHFRYEETARRKMGKGGKEPHFVDHEMKEPPTDGIAATVMSPEGKGAYENPDLSTNL